MLIHPQIDPVALQLGPVAVHWYGLTYLAAFGLFMLLGLRRLRHQPFASLQGAQAWSRRDVEDILFLGCDGSGAGWAHWLLPVLQTGLLPGAPTGGVCRVAGWHEFSWWHAGCDRGRDLVRLVAQASLLQVADFVAPCVPTGLAMGRVGNFINGELWGRVASADLPWGMVFRGAGDLPRHPSQVYQFLLEGLLLFVLLWLYARRPRAPGRVAAAFLLGMACFASRRSFSVNQTPIWVC
jgi:phosphatidylglycerol:prolipoprotein diacylglycerol transferase